jgi:thiamine-monophosphate kinase
MAKASEVGEFALIERIRSRKARRDEDLVVGIGDDGAVLRRGPVLEVLTTDCLVEGTHYEPGWLSMKDIGWKALAVNISDIAAMGGHPAHALVTLFLPDDFTTQQLDDLYEGLEECGEAMGVTVVGGDIVKIKGPFAVSIALSGICDRDQLVLRSGARQDDIIVVTGCLGEAAVGLRALRGEKGGLDDDLIETCTWRFKRPVPRLKESRAIIEGFLPSSMIDISDGLLSDLWHILEASNVGAVLDADTIPVGRCVIDFFSGKKEEALSLAINGGEDYELLFTIDCRHGEQLPGMATKMGIGLNQIGKITPKSSGVKLAGKEGERELGRGGFDHFKPAGL